MLVIYAKILRNYLILPWLYWQTLLDLSIRIYDLYRVTHDFSKKYMSFLDKNCTFLGTSHKINLEFLCLWFKTIFQGTILFELPCTQFDLLILLEFYENSWRQFYLSRYLITHTYFLQLSIVSVNNEFLSETCLSARVLWW